MRKGGADIGADQRIFQNPNGFGIEPLFGENAGQPAGELRRGARKARFQAREHSEPGGRNFFVGHGWACTPC